MNTGTGIGANPETTGGAGTPAGGAVPTRPATARERMAVLLSRQLSDGWSLGVGARSTLPMAAAMLAQATHAPNLTVLCGGIYVNPRRLVPFAAGYDCHPDSTGDFVDVYQLTERGVDAICFSGMQIDRFGTINLHWVDRPGGGRFRGPGIANTSFGHTARRVLLWVERHERRILVPEVDFASVVGLAHRGRRRAELGLPNLGPTMLLTPSVLFTAEGGELVPREWHGAEDWAQVRAATGWELPEQPPARSAEPTGSELAVLRTRVDPMGLLRG
jgi:glutaconate CoA-transferase subunit B